MLKTRLDGRSKDNASFEIKNELGTVMATIKLADASGVTLEISTREGLYIEKPSGWNSRKK